MGNSGITCFKTGWSALLDVDLWVKWFDIFASLATTLAVFAAIFAAYIGYQQLISNAKETRNATACNIYQQYLALCMANPNFSNGMAKPESRSKEYTQYCWFISSMLFSFEKILETQKGDPQWVKTIESQLMMHKEHLKSSDTVKDEQWEKELDNIIKKVIR
ncbi:hypothetical protein BCU88_21800 [Vibrio splendidus]|uniref:hypothetical protein n=1 Tax=Vibrio splendidus TaxID=29497 RepID=UPI000C8391A3|nr:hypothetical protein [Vibrio splendidus]PMG52886.1 hypothetical protein BCU88_21800 [Vibrio splendidus]